MIQIKYEDLGKMGMQRSVQKLANSTFKDTAAFRAMYVTKALRDGFFKMREEYKEIETKFAVKKDGKVDAPAEGSEAAKLELPFAVDTGKEAVVKAALDAFGKRTLDIKYKKIPAETIMACNEWSPLELEALEAIVEFPTES